MAQPYPHLLSPLQCGKFIFKNRMQSSNSLPHFSQGPEKYPADPTIAHFLGRAKSGAAFVTLAGFEDSVNAPQFPDTLDMSHFPEFDLRNALCQNYMVELIEAMHYEGTLVSGSLFSATKTFRYENEKGEVEIIDANPPIDMTLGATSMIIQQTGDGGNKDIPLRRVTLFQKGIHPGEHILLAAGCFDGVDILRTRVVHAGHHAVHLAGVGIPHFAPDEVRHIPPACGQGSIVAVKVKHLSAQRPGGVHVADPLQLEQRHLPLRTDGKDLIRLAALRRRVQAAYFFQKIHPVAPKLQLHFPAHTVGGNNFSGFQILLHKFAPVLSNLCQYALISLTAFDSFPRPGEAL